MGRGDEPTELNIGMVYRPTIRSLEIILSFQNFAYELTISLLEGNVCGFRISGERYSNSGIMSVHDLKEAMLSGKQFAIEAILGGATIPDLERNAKKILEWLDAKAE
jgi:hypothetical protein